MMWTQQRFISILIIATTTFGGLCHGFTIMASLIRPESPFQTHVSLVIQAHQDEYSSKSCCGVGSWRPRETLMLSGLWLN
ncbi:hypothetical protein EDB19DRAFT_1728424 [Suillus lakei]|nr:hypothetical protein EDB19DRAFT_1728424 [Suillus lakei]